MASGALSEVGLGAETTYGTGVSSVFYLSSASVNITEDRQQLREDFQFGHRGLPQADDGRLRITGSIDGIHVRPDNLGDLLRGLLGDPTDAGAGPYTHTYEDTVAKFATAAALPPYTATVTYDANHILRYTGGQLNSMTLQQAKDARLIANTSWLFKDVGSTSSETPSLESNSPFNYANLAVQRNSSDFDYFEDLTITISNPVVGEELLDQATTITCTEFDGPISVEVSGTVSAKDTTLYSDFSTPTAEDWTFTWTSGADILAITIDRLKLSAHNYPINGAGRNTFTVTGMAEYGTGNSRSLNVVLTNSIAAYPQT